MTKREMLYAIAARVADNAEMVAFLNKEIKAIDAHNARATVKRSEGAAAKREAVYEALAAIGEQVTATELIENAENEVRDYSRQKVSAALTALVKEGRVYRELYKHDAYFAVVGD
jgi:Fe2+ or Zn2+ uptake regulation protein